MVAVGDVDVVGADELCCKLVSVIVDGIKTLNPKLVGDWRRYRTLSARAASVYAFSSQAASHRLQVAQNSNS